MKLTAVKSVTYNKVKYTKGETFEVPDKWGRVLRLIGRAKLAEGGDEFGIEKPKKARPAFKEYTAPAVAAKPAAPVAAKPVLAKRGRIATGEKKQDPHNPKMTNEQWKEAQRLYVTRDMGTQPPSAPAAEPVKVDDVEADQVVRPHEKPAE